jgi:hypothetical protein
MESFRAILAGVGRCPGCRANDSSIPLPCCRSVVRRLSPENWHQIYKIPARRCPFFKCLPIVKMDCALQPDESSLAIEKLDSRGPFFCSVDWLCFGITALTAFAVYFCTIAPEVTLEDGGTFITGAAYAGVPDCPGFPVWTIYSWVWIKLFPFSNVAWRATVGSAWAAALACGLTALMVSRGGALLLGSAPVFSLPEPREQNLLRGVCGCVAGLALGLCETIWIQVDRLNIWAVSTLLFAAMLVLLMRWTASPQRRLFLYAAVFVFGLVLTNCQYWVVFAPGLVIWVLLNDAELGRDLFLFLFVVVFGLWEITRGQSDLPYFDDAIRRNIPLVVPYGPAVIWTVIAAIKTRRLGSEWKSAILCGLIFLTGLGAYLYPALASMTNPPLNWGYPRTVEGFWHLVTRGQYDRINPTRDLGVFIGQLGVFVRDIGKQFGWLYLIFIPLPFCYFRQAPREARRWMVGLTIAFACMGPMMVAMLNPTRDRQTNELVHQYFSAMYVVLAVWTGLGLMAAGMITAEARGKKI